MASKTRVTLLATPQHNASLGALKGEVGRGEDRVVKVVVVYVCVIFLFW